VRNAPAKLKIFPFASSRHLFKGLLDTTQVQYLRRYLTDLGATSVLEEQNYFDRDYLAEFSAFYSISSTGYPNVCRRLHFFFWRPAETANFASCSFWEYRCCSPTPGALPRLCRYSAYSIGTSRAHRFSLVSRTDAEYTQSEPRLADTQRTLLESSLRLPALLGNSKIQAWARARRSVFGQCCIRLPLMIITLCPLLPRLRNPLIEQLL